MQTNPTLNDLNVLPQVLIELKEILEKHDWFYSYSDDHTVWQKGRDQRSDIRTLLNQANELGYGDAASEIYNKHVPDALKMTRSILKEGQQ
tara:strand:- start:6277 stop:6549 length:273 start_codon:yes stop_codon:yes gene_type:complete